MIQYEIFLKEISNFLRTCTVKNKYFAQITAKNVKEKYGLSDLPDHFNPYYLRMCGLSTIDLTIPQFLLEDDGITITANSDREYRCITDSDPELTEILFVRLETISTEDKILYGLDQIEKGIGQAYLNFTGFESDKEYDAIVWRLDIVKDKLTTLRDKMAAISPNDGRLSVINIISGEITWEDVKNSPMIARHVDTRNDIASLTDVQLNDIIACDTEKTTYEFLGDRWATITNCKLFDLTANFYKAVNGYTDNQVKIIITVSVPNIEALVVVGSKSLNWKKMHESYDLLKEYDTKKYNDGKHGPIYNSEFDKINELLGFTSVGAPDAGSRINFINKAFAWTNGERIYYSKSEVVAINDTIYKDTTFNAPVSTKVQSYNVYGGSARINIGGIFTRYPEGDIFLNGKTLEFNGIDWTEVTCMQLFRDEWKKQFQAIYGNYAKFTFTVMETPYDKESFNERLIALNSVRTVLDRYEYTGWDKPLYVPTYDHANALTKDFTLYCRYYNRMSEENLKTSLKYAVGTTQWKNVSDEYPNYLDYIRGVHYPCTKFTRDDLLVWSWTTNINDKPLRIAARSDYEAYIAKIQAAIQAIVDQPNYTLLQYDSTFLKENEADSLIDCVKNTLSCMRERWDIAEFGYEELYYSAVWAVIWSHLPYALLVQRIKNLRTEAVHIDHIWEFLESRGLKDYRTVMDTEQQVFLYKNIDYLRGNEGKQSTLKILSDKLLSKFNAEVRTKSVLLSTVDMKDNTEADMTRSGTHLVNGLSEGSVTGKVKILSEDLDEKTSITSDMSGRIEDFDMIYLREYNSGLEPKYGNLTDERDHNIASAHNEIEKTKHTYAPTKLAEITQGSVNADVTRLVMSSIFQNLLRKLSSSYGRNNATDGISDTCTINAIFSGLSTPKTFTIGEALALIFYALRKQDWYLGKDKAKEQIINKQDIWLNIVNEKGVSPTLTEHEELLSRIIPYKNCEESVDHVTVGKYTIDRHEHYDLDEVFNDTIPRTANVWMAYLGDYTRAEDLKLVEGSLPYAVTDIRKLIGNPDLIIKQKSMYAPACYRELMQVVSPCEYKDDKIVSWNAMCNLRKGYSVNLNSFDIITGSTPLTIQKKTVTVDPPTELLYESLMFTPIGGETTLSDETKPPVDGATNVGGIITGSTRSKSDKYYFSGIPDPNTMIETHDDLIKLLNDMASVLVYHFQTTRNTVDAFFQTGMNKIYDCITIKDKVAVDLVPGYTRYDDWFDSDIEMRAVFRSIEAGSDQAAVYGSIADNLINALFPLDKITAAGTTDQTKYAAMKELFQWMCSYNIAFLNTSSVQYECLFTHPITINVMQANGENDRSWLLWNDHKFADRIFYYTKNAYAWYCEESDETIFTPTESPEVGDHAYWSRSFEVTHDIANNKLIFGDMKEQTKETIHVANTSSIVMEHIDEQWDEYHDVCTYIKSYKTFVRYPEKDSPRRKVDFERWSTLDYIYFIRTCDLSLRAKDHVVYYQDTKLFNKGWSLNVMTTRTLNTPVDSNGRVVRPVTDERTAKLLYGSIQNRDKLIAYTYTDPSSTIHQDHHIKPAVSTVLREGAVFTDAELLYGNNYGAEGVLVNDTYSRDEVLPNQIKSRDLKTTIPWEHKTASHWTSITDPQHPDTFPVKYNTTTDVYTTLEEDGNRGVICGNKTDGDVFSDAELLYGSDKNASAIPHLKTVYHTFNQTT